MSFLYGSAQFGNALADLAELRERNDALEARVAKLEAQLPKAPRELPPPDVDALHSQTKELRLVQDALSPMTFTALSIYHHNSASIRVRIISNTFKYLTKGARVDLVNAYLDKLPAEIAQKILVLQLFTEEEARISPPAWPE